MSEVYRVQPVPHPIDAVVEVPGSRSITNRALVCAALARGTSRLTGWLDADDTVAMRDALVALGATIRIDGDALIVDGTAGTLFPPRKPLDCHASGSTLRFLTAVASLVDGWVTLDGTPRLRERPLAELCAALEAVGVTVRGTHAPVSVCGPILDREVTLDASRSGQFLSGLLLAAPCTKDGMRITVGEIASEPFVEMTRRVMEAFGARVSKLWARVTEPPDRSDPSFRIGSLSRSTYLVSATGYTASDYAIEPDVMSASYLFAAAAVTGGSVLVRGTQRDSMQGDVLVLDAFEAMGCRIEQTPDGIRVTGAPLRGTIFDVSALPDMAPTLAVVACFAQGHTTITGTGLLSTKESDRATALHAELTKLGATVTLERDRIRIEPPGEIAAARIATYDDHRIAMAFSVAGLVARGIEIDDPGVVAKTFPGFYDVLERLRLQDRGDDRDREDPGDHAQ